MTALICTKGSKFLIGDKAYAYNVGMQTHLILEISINGIVKNEDGLYYTCDKNLWYKEENLFKSRKEAYNHLIKQAESEMLEAEK